MQADLQAAVRDRRAKCVGDDDEEDADRADAQEQRHDRRLRIRSDSKCGAGVSHVDELKKIRDERNGVVHVDVRADHPLRPCIQRDDCQRNQKIGEAFHRVSSS